MKSFSEISNSSQLISWELSDYAISIQHYSAQELKDLHGMIIFASAELTAGKSALIGKFIDEFKEQYFDSANLTHTKLLSELVTIAVYEQELVTKAKLCDYYEYLRIPSCFVQ
jgi:hypothetical protein